MPAGTIALANNSTTVTGTGTSFTTELKVNDFVVAVVGGVAYTLGVAAIASNTSLTLIQKYDGPTTSGLTWNPVPFGTMTAITAQLAAQVTYAIRGLNLDKNNWQQVFTGTGNITVNLPDGSSYTGPAWNGITSAIANKADLSGATFKGDLKTEKWLYVDGQANFNAGSVLKGKTVVDGEMAFSTTYNAGLFRNNAGLKALAILDTVSRSVLDPELKRNLFAAGATPSNSGGAGVWQWTNTAWGYGETYGTTIQVNNRQDSSGAAGSNIWQHYLGLGTSGNLFYAVNINGTFASYKIYSNKNTTTNSSGALVPASPIVRIVSSKSTCTRSDVFGVENSEYIWQGEFGLNNDESQGCEVSRTDVGTYLVKGAVGLAKDLWSVMDCGNGQGRIVALAEAEEIDGGVVVRCFKQKYSLSEEGDLTMERGGPLDIPVDTWIDVRLEMPDNSAYNLQQKPVALKS